MLQLHRVVREMNYHSSILQCFALVVMVWSSTTQVYAFQILQKRHAVRLDAKRTTKRGGGGGDAGSFFPDKISTMSRRLLKKIARETEEYVTQQAENGPLSQEEQWIVKAIQELCAAKHQTEQERIGHWLFYQANFAEFSYHHSMAIQALALTGQVDRALQKVESNNDDANDQPFLTIVQVLRDEGRLADLKELLKRLGRDPSRHGVSVRAFNTFLCELPSLDVMYHELITSEALLGIVPDAISYSIVLHQAAVKKNPTMMKAVWDRMKEASVQPVIECFNARLRIAETSEEILQIWDTKIQTNKDLKPDMYTIEYVLLPLIQAGRIRDLKTILDTFIASSHPYVVTNSFTPFLLKLGREGRAVDAARHLWDTYRMDGRLQPNVRHFNVLLGCYRFQMCGNVTSASGKRAHDEGWDLYQTLALCQPKIVPDAITIIEMIGLCQDANELATFLGGILTSPYTRVTVTSFGRFGDASSALWLFAKKAPDTSKAWNTLLGSLTKAMAYNYDVKPLESRIAFALEKKQVSLVATQLVNSDSLLLGDAPLNEKIEETFAFMLASKKVDSQSFCLMASFHQRQESFSPNAARDLYTKAAALGVEPDGRFLNGILRWFGPNLSDALDLWKTNMRPKVLSVYQNSTKVCNLNLNAAYIGLFYVCGRSLRPDVALRICYAMEKDGLEPDERCLNTYRIGRRDHGRISAIKERLLDIHESLFEVECSKSSGNNWQKRNDAKVRLILSPKREHDYILD